MTCNVLVIGAGTAGVAAAIAAAESGARVIVAEEGPWVGGMLTAAGVSAIDGNHSLPSGLWGRFRRRLYAHYGGPRAVETGWISRTLFDPRVAEEILRQMMDLPGLTLLTGLELREMIVDTGPAASRAIRGARFRRLSDGGEVEIRAGVTIAADEFGDAAYLSGLPLHTGIESRRETGETQAPEEPHPVPQDMTWVATLHASESLWRHPGLAASGAAPPRHLPSFPRILTESPHSWRDFFSYARLPGELFMLNWPIHGNDFAGDYLRSRENGGALPAESPDARAAALAALREHREGLFAAAREKTLRLVRELQEAFPDSGLALAGETYPTETGLPPLPYIRESWRIYGETLVTLNDILAAPGAAAGSAEDPDVAERAEQLRHRAVAVGNYPVDHHRLEDPGAPRISFPSIPSFSLPVDVLIPENTTGLLVAEKSISVSGLVNGCSRLQPVVMLLGEAAGVLAAMASRATPADPRDPGVHSLQEALLARACMLLPYSDLAPEDPDFAALQRAGIRGTLRGQARSEGWENQTLLHPDAREADGRSRREHARRSGTAPLDACDNRRENQV